MKKTLINIFGAPKAGKTTLMSAIFLNLKMQGVYCEMAADFPKGVLFEENKALLKNQLYIFAMQEKRISDLYKYADVVITDCPILHSIVYNSEEYKTLHPFIVETHNKYNNINIFLQKKQKVTYGSFRLFSSEELQQIERDIFKLLQDYQYIHLLQTPNEILQGVYIINKILNKE